MYKTPPSLNSLCFSHVGCSWRFGALRKTSSRESFCEFFSHFWKSTSCNLHMWRRFVLKSFFVYKYLWGVSRQLSQRRGSEAANYVLDLDLKMQKHCRKTALSTSEHSMKTARHTKWPCFLQPFSGFLHFWPYWHQMRNWGFRFEWIVSVSKQNIDHGAGFGANTSLQWFSTQSECNGSRRSRPFRWSWQCGLGSVWYRPADTTLWVLHRSSWKLLPCKKEVGSVEAPWQMTPPAACLKRHSCEICLSNYVLWFGAEKCQSILQAF